MNISCGFISAKLVHFALGGLTISPPFSVKLKHYLTKVFSISQPCLFPKELLYLSSVVALAALMLLLLLHERVWTVLCLRETSSPGKPNPVARVDFATFLKWLLCRLNRTEANDWFHPGIMLASQWLHPFVISFNSSNLMKLSTTMASLKRLAFSRFIER